MKFLLSSIMTSNDNSMVIKEVQFTDLTVRHPYDYVFSLEDTDSDKMHEMYKTEFPNPPQPVWTYVAPDWAILNPFEADAKRRELDSYREKYHNEMEVWRDAYRKRWLNWNRWHKTKEEKRR